MQRRRKKAALEQVRLEVEETKSGMGAGYKKCTVPTVVPKSVNAIVKLLIHILHKFLVHSLC